MLYDGRTDPDGFADITVSDDAHTLVGTTPTGMTQLYIDSQIQGPDELHSNETGPLRVEAEFGELNATTGNQSIVDVETSSTIDPTGAREFKSVTSSWGTPLYAGTEDPEPEQIFAGAHSHPATPRVTYSVLHGPGDFSGVENTDVLWQADESVAMAAGMDDEDHDGFKATAATEVDPATPSPLKANLTVTGPDGSVTSVTQRLYIEPSQGTAHVQPHFTADKLTLEPGETVTFNASLTDAPAWTAYNWYIGNETITKEPGGGPGD